jgi:hypothetical protein
VGDSKSAHSRMKNDTRPGSPEVVISGMATALRSGSNPMSAPFL